ncbi:MAG: hydrogenase iron-sulfur subunit [Anaerolineales bacterium]
MIEIETQEKIAHRQEVLHFEPEITAFTCMYCGYTAIDAAGTMRLAYPANLKVVRLPCAGKLDILYLLQAFEEGADGVMVVACTVGNCHHIQGNLRAKARLERARDLLQKVGIEGERVHMVLVSGGQGGTVAREAQSHVERVRALGPSPLRLK